MQTGLELRVQPPRRNRVRATNATQISPTARQPLAATGYSTNSSFYKGFIRVSWDCTSAANRCSVGRRPLPDSIGQPAGGYGKRCRQRFAAIHAGKGAAGLHQRDRLHRKLGAAAELGWKVGLLHPGDEVPVFVDSFPNKAFTGHVEHIDMQGQYSPRNLQTADERANQVFAARVSLEIGRAHV